MIYRSISIPGASKGIKIPGKKLTQPNQSMSLQEILERFTRGEKLNIGQEPQYHESEDDLEKVSHMDLVDKEEFVKSLEQTRSKHAAQEKRKAEKAKKDAHDQAVAQAAAALAKKKGDEESPPAK